MPYMPDYFEKQLLPFEELEFNPLDAVTFSQFAMIQAQDTIPAMAVDAASESRIPRQLRPRPAHAHFSDLLRAEHFPTMFDALNTPKKAKQTLFGVNISPRYRDMLVLDYQNVFDPARVVQFGAVTCVYKRKFAVIGFRGTDASMTGWHEDFDMAYMDPVPSQTLALDYLNAVASQGGIPKTLYIVGHSKGGNLAEYVALRCSSKIQKRIKHVYNLDGPGFKPGMFTEADYAPLKRKITKIVPQGSMIGILLRSYAPLRIAKSDAEGFDQHSTFTWELNAPLDDFVYEEKLTRPTQDFKKNLETWLAEYDDSQLEALTDVFFKALEIVGAKNPLAFLQGGNAGVSLIIEALRKLDRHDRSLLTSAFSAYLKVLSQNEGGSVGFAAGTVARILDHFPSTSS